MNDLIRRSDAIEALCGECSGNCIPCESFPCGDIKAIQKLPSATRTGRWTNNMNGTFTCDQCGCKHSRSNFCPNCGARMEDAK